MKYNGFIMYIVESKAKHKPGKAKPVLTKSYNMQAGSLERLSDKTLLGMVG